MWQCVPSVLTVRVTLNVLRGYCNLLPTPHRPWSHIAVDHDYGSTHLQWQDSHNHPSRF